MKHFITWIVLGTAVFLSSAVWARSKSPSGTKLLANSDEAKALSEKFLRTIQDSTPAAGLDLLKGYSCFMTDANYNGWLSQMTGQRKNYETQYGKLRGYTLMKQQSIADTFLRLTYIERSEKAVIHWAFTYYNPSGDGWCFYGMTWDYSIEPLFSALSLSGASLA